MLYVPVSLVMPEETTPVSVLVAVTVTPGINALAASDTVPLRLALLDWLNTGTEASSKNKSVDAIGAFRMISPPGIDDQ